MKEVKICALVIGTLLTATLLGGCSAGKKSVSAQELFDADVSGFNDHAWLNLRVGSSQKDTVGDRLTENFDENDYSKYAEYFEYSANLSNFFDSVQYTIVSEKKSDFSNGDIINIETSYDQELANKLNINMTDTTFSYTVSGLSDGQIVNPFDGLVISYEGIAPNASAVFDSSDCNDYVRNNVKFSVDGANSGLSNGETITVKADYDFDKAENNAIMISETERQYIVNDVLEYPTSLDNVDLTAITAQFEDMLEAKAMSRVLSGTDVNVSQIVDSFGAKMKITKAESSVKLKAYLKSKTTDPNEGTISVFGNGSPYNEYDCIWEINVTGTCTNQGYASEPKVKQGDTMSYKLYYVAYIQNIPVDSQNTIPEEYLTNYKEEFYENGTVDYSEVYNDWITKNKSKYNITEIN